MLEILIIMNNYLHDLATGMLFASAIMVFILYKHVLNKPNQESVRFVNQILQKYTWVSRVALAWVILGGIPRMIYFKQIEWTIALDNGIIPALIFKHIILFGMVIGGVVFWQKLAKQFKKFQ